MKKVLMISYVWPPMEGVGLMRAFKFAKYLPQFGWQPIVLTVRSGAGAAELSGDIKVFRTGYADVVDNVKSALFGKPAVRSSGASLTTVKKYTERPVRKSSFLREMVAMPDDQIGWLRFGVEEGGKVMEEERPDIIFSTSPPETAHLIAQKLKDKYNVPWVADLRDLWSEDHFRSRPMIKKAMLRFMERGVLGKADTVLTVSDPWADNLRKSLGGATVKVVENGFDEEDFTALRYEGNKKFTISYAGKLHKYNQPVDHFFTALSELIREGRLDRGRVEARFHVFGYDKPDISAMAKHFGLDGVVVECPRVNYSQSAALQRASDALLFVQWQGRSSEGWYSAKLYDYIGARRPVLALGKAGGIIDGLIKSTGCGIVAETVADAKEFIAKLYEEYVETGKVLFSGNETEIAGHTRLERVKALAGIFDTVAGGKL